MNDELQIEDLAVTVDPSACIEISRSPTAIAKAAVQTVTDILLAVLSHM